VRVQKNSGWGGGFGRARCIHEVAVPAGSALRELGGFVGGEEFGQPSVAPSVVQDFEDCWEVPLPGAAKPEIR
jgi:hypothetical protein